MPTMEAVVDRGESPQLRIVGAGDGGEAIRAGVEPLLRVGVDSWKTVRWLAVPLAAAVFAEVRSTGYTFSWRLGSFCNCHPGT